MENPDTNTVEVTDPDLWWAFLGGGGSVYGVATQFVLKLHLPPDSFVNFRGSWTIATSGD